MDLCSLILMMQLIYARIYGFFDRMPSLNPHSTLLFAGASENFSNTKIALLMLVAEKFANENRLKSP